MKQPPRLPASFASAVDLSSLNKPTAATNKVQTGGNPYVIDVTEETFEVAVIQESSNVPVKIRARLIARQPMHFAGYQKLLSRLRWLNDVKFKSHMPSVKRNQLVFSLKRLELV